MESNGASPTHGDLASQRPQRVGLLGRLGPIPDRGRQALRRQGCKTYCLGVIGHADPALADVCDEFQWIGLAKLSGALRFFRRHGVTDATMIGKIHKAVLFGRGGWICHLPDLRTIRAFLPHFLTRRKDCKDDSLLGTLVDAFAAGGVRFGPATDYAPELLVKEGQLTRQGPSGWQWKDIEFGWTIAKELGRLDIGQSVAVKNQAVLAVEAIEGTDECIRRAGMLCRGGGHGRQSGQTAAGHAVRRAHHRHADPGDDDRRRGQGIGGGSRPHDHPRRGQRDRIRQSKPADPGGDR